MFNNDTIFGTPDYLKSLNEEDFTLNIENISSHNISGIIEILENADVEELDKIKTKYELDDDIIYTCKIKKDKLLLEYISKKNYKEIYNRLEDLEVIPKNNLYENAYSKLFKIGEDPEVKPQSVVFVFPVAGVFLFVGAVYVGVVHSAAGAVNGYVAANFVEYVSIKFEVYGYIKKNEPILLKLILNLFPKFESLVSILDTNMSEIEQDKFFSFILKETVEKMKIELQETHKFNLFNNPLISKLGC